MQATPRKNIYKTLAISIIIALLNTWLTPWHAPLIQITAISIFNFLFWTAYAASNLLFKPFLIFTVIGAAATSYFYGLSPLINDIAALAQTDISETSELIHNRIASFSALILTLILCIYGIIKTNFRVKKNISSIAAIIPEFYKYDK